MKKYRVFIGFCGNEKIMSGIIKAEDKREALEKYYAEIGIAADAEKIENELKYVLEVN